MIVIMIVCESTTPRTPNSHTLNPPHTSRRHVLCAASVWCIYLYLRSFDLDRQTARPRMVTTELTVSTPMETGAHVGGSAGASVLGGGGLLSDVESGGAFESDL